MKRKITILLGALLVMAVQPAKAQFATFDASNLAQAVLSYVQDADNITLNTEQFLQNLGVMQEQLQLLQDLDKRYKKVRAQIWKGQEVIRIAQNYEMTYKMFSNYVDRLKAMNGQDLQYYQIRSAINEGFNYLLIASREVKRAREYLSTEAQLSEEARLAGLQACDKQLSRVNAAMARHMMDQYDAMDRGRILAASKKALDEAFTVR